MQWLFLAAYGMIFRHKYEDVGTPCKKTVTGDLIILDVPTSTYAIREPKTWATFLVKGNSAEILPGKSVIWIYIGGLYEVVLSMMAKKL